MKKKKNIFEHGVEDISTEMTDHMIDCHMISLDEVEDSEEEAMG